MVMYPCDKMNDKEIMEMGYEQVDRNVYRKNGTLYTQHYGELERIDSIEPSEIRGIIPEEYIREASQEVTTEAYVPEIPSEPMRTEIVERRVDTPPTQLMTLVDDIDAIAGLYEQFSRLKERIISKDDVHTAHGATYIKKSGWRKIATAFGISDELISTEREDLPGGGVRYTVMVRAFAPNGRQSVGVGMCDTEERTGKGGTKKVLQKTHDILTTAHTRAKNRAISDLLGGDVSAEEMS